MNGIRVVAITAKDICYPWTSAPYVSIPRPAKNFYDRQLPIDPFPAYAHDCALVEKVARQVVRTLPIHVPVIISVLDREGPERTNGHCDILYDYNVKKPHPWAASIVLWGKRIPPHPAMTRYLVAHEYGHAVEKLVSSRRGDTDGHKLLREYRRLRPPVARVKYYGGGTWHRSTGEVFANDFRILVAGVEAEFWPHAGIPRPERVASVRAFWREHAA